jgi:hypothetical protein
VRKKHQYQCKKRNHGHRDYDAHYKQAGSDFVCVRHPATSTLKKRSDLGQVKNAVQISKLVRPE